MKFATLAVHAGQRPDPHTGAVNIAVSLTSTFQMDGIGKLRNGFEYARSDNPSRRSLETSIATLEGGKHALCFASGQAASTAILDLLEPNDEIVTTANIYGGTYRLFHKVYQKYGITVRVADKTTPESIQTALSDKTTLVWTESPSNPLLTLLDLAETAQYVKNFKNRKGEKPFLVVDNTFPSPAFQNPLALGADIVSHSCTKYIGGHSDVIGGAIVVNDETLWQQLKFYQNAAGAVQGPMDCYLLQRGLRTLPLRMKKHEENAYRVAEFLRGHSCVEEVFFPGFEDFPNHHLVAKQMKGLPGIVSFKIRNGNLPCVNRFFEGLKLFILAESLGGVESLLCHPASMTHAALPESERQKIGITDNLIRLSMGIEDADDLIEDLRNALNQLSE
ncbi:MAG: aminotransferase class I/II-fold pyridoxal phosphate-dependent enzyme [Planctomycetaceae bacterium]|jgi:cystathionine beta-lyase/cystathionine gamma-synthase|nr:aminotransferase class I/II-fold pyridoxal phosphate-dependent enzyme [Planctomycetaceae bacterium]